MTNWTHKEVLDTDREFYSVPISYHGKVDFGMVAWGIFPEMKEYEYALIALEYEERYRMKFSDKA